MFQISIIAFTDRITPTIQIIKVIILFIFNNYYTPNYTPSDAATAFIFSSACAFTASYSAGEDNVPRTST